MCLQAFAAILLGSLGSLSFPAISSIKANNVVESEQGTIQVLLSSHLWQRHAVDDEMQYMNVV